MQVPSFLFFFWLPVSLSINLIELEALVHDLVLGPCGVDPGDGDPELSVDETKKQSGEDAEVEEIDLWSFLHRLGELVHAPCHPGHQQCVLYIYIYMTTRNQPKNQEKYRKIIKREGVIIIAWTLKFPSFCHGQWVRGPGCEAIVVSFLWIFFFFFFWPWCHLPRVFIYTSIWGGVMWEGPFVNILVREGVK